MRKNYTPFEGAKTYVQELTVVESEIDALNHVNNVVYLQWVNNIAEKHWAVLSNKNIDSKYFWVCTRHEIDYLGESLIGDSIKVVTWIGQTGGVKSIRYVNIYKGEKLIVTVSSTWCLIDMKTKRPTRIKEDVLSLLV